MDMLLHIDLDTSVPYCPLDSCDDPTQDNGNTVPAPSSDGRYPLGSNVTISCDPGFTAHGNTNIICQDVQSWNPQPPTCRLGDQIFDCTIVLNLK